MHVMLHPEWLNGNIWIGNGGKPYPKHLPLPSSISGSEVTKKIAAILEAILNSAFNLRRIHGDF